MLAYVNGTNLSLTSGTVCEVMARLRRWVIGHPYAAIIWTLAINLACAIAWFPFFTHKGSWTLGVVMTLLGSIRIIGGWIEADWRKRRAAQRLAGSRPGQIPN
jgi:hypothetical protein